MKVTVDVECTPEEARAFLGLPDVQPLQQEILREMQDRMTANIRAMDVQDMMRLWMPASVAGLEQMQAFFAQMAGARSK